MIYIWWECCFLILYFCGFWCCQPCVFYLIILPNLTKAIDLSYYSVQVKVLPTLGTGGRCRPPLSGCRPVGCTDLPQSLLMHVWKTYLTDNLPNGQLLRHDLYPIIIKMIIIFTWGNIFSSPVVCLCHGFMSVVDRAPWSRLCLCRA